MQTMTREGRVNTDHIHEVWVAEQSADVHSAQSPCRTCCNASLQRTKTPVRQTPLCFLHTRGITQRYIKPVYTALEKKPKQTHAKHTSKQFTFVH